MRRCRSAVLLATLGVAVPAMRAARAEEIDEGVRFKSVLVQGNPLAFAIGRYSMDLEYLPAPHHALHLTPLYYYALPGTDDQLTGYGAEVGYRFYTGWHGPHGFFAGGSLIVAGFEYIHGNPTNVAGDQADDTQYLQIGGAIDVGYQAIILGNFCVGVGLGAQYTADTSWQSFHVTTNDPHFEYQSHPFHDLVYGWGLRPRILLQVGAAF